MVIKTLGVEVGREGRDGVWGQARWLTSFLGGPSFSKTSDGMVGMNVPYGLLLCL